MQFCNKPSEHIEIENEMILIDLQQTRVENLKISDFAYVDSKA